MVLLKESLLNQIYCLGMYKLIVFRFSVYDTVLLKQRAILQKQVEWKFLFLVLLWQSLDRPVLPMSLYSQLTFSPLFLRFTVL